MSEQENNEMLTSLISDEAFTELERYNNLLSEILDKAKELISLQSKLSPTDKRL